MTASSANRNSLRHFVCTLVITLSLDSLKRFPLDLESLKRFQMDLESLKRFPLDLESLKRFPLDLESLKRFPLDLESLKRFPLDLVRREMPLVADPKACFSGTAKKMPNSVEARTPLSYSAVDVKRLHCTAIVHNGPHHVFMK